MLLAFKCSTMSFAQRLTAIMVIHDIDETIDILKGLKEAEEKNDKRIQFVLKYEDKLESLPYDTLYQAIIGLTRSVVDFRFDISKENIFNSDVDTWQNLGSMKFIDNMQSFFHDRQALQDMLNEPNYYAEPISYEEYMQEIRPLGWVSQEQFAEVMRPFLKEKLSDPHVRFYINMSSERIRGLNQCIDSWSRLNEENKFLMGITDKELDDYINSITNNGKAVSEARLAGRWEYAMEDENTYVFDFHRDHHFDYTLNYSALSHSEFWSGRIKYTVTLGGTWALQADSLILNYNYSNADMQVDISGLEALENKQDTLESWARHFRENALEYYAEKSGEGDRVAYKARLDSSNDKMEWSGQQSGKTKYLKRKE